MKRPRARSRRSVRVRVSAVLAVAAGAVLSVAAGGVPASAQPARTTLVFAEKLGYTCDGPCATATSFTAWGTLLSPGSGLGVLHETILGTVVDYDPATNCLDQVEQWTVTGPGGKDQLTFTTETDTFCFTADPNVNHETGTFTLTGGTGRFRDATGSGSFDERVLTQPQIGTGTITVVLRG
jgi:hypothetical protein